jgi:transcription elongation GreA/GreB family factor
VEKLTQLQQVFGFKDSSDLELRAVRISNRRSLEQPRHFVWRNVVAQCDGIAFDFTLALNKQILIKNIIARLATELELYRKAARAARAEATDEQSKAENKYDTRGLEASYLARGQSRQAAEIEQSIQAFERMAVRTFNSNDPLDLGALVELESDGERSVYFIGPRAGGTEVTQGRQEVLVITPESPLGQQLVGKKQGDKLQIVIAGSRKQFCIAAIS